MIKIAEIWGLDFAKLATELEHNTAGVTHIVLDFLCEISYVLKHPSYNKILDIAYRDNIPVTILTPYLKEMPPLLDFNDAKYKNITVVHWETFWFNRTYEAWKFHDISNKQKNLEMFNLRNGEHFTDFKYSYITLNNISKNHRCLIMDLLAKHNLIEHGAIAWRDIRRDCDDIRHTFPDDITDSAYRNYPYKYWKPKRLILDQDIKSVFLQETLPIEFNQSFMQLVTESDNEVIFFSEKTATPILLNKPFLIGGAKDNHIALKHRGFELYDEIFDYGFDSEKDDSLRYEGLVENIKKINSLPKSELTKLYKSLFEKFAYNKKHAIDLINEVPNEVSNLLSLIRQENQEPYSGPLNMLL